MPLNRPALTLGSGPRGVQDARRWVVDVCEDIDRPDLFESAELGVSELVTNALLHGADPIQVRVRGTIEHPRIEVRDASVDAPVLPGLNLDADDDLLLTFGRGLSIVARISDAWGAEIETDGKVVWFAPKAELSEVGVEGVVHGNDIGPVAAEMLDPVDVDVHAMPVKLFLDFRNHFRELQREVRLLALAHRDDYPLAAQLSHLFADLFSQLRVGTVHTAVASALSQDAEVIDLHVRIPSTAVGTVQQLLEVLDMADDFCRQERLLALARTDEQRDFQRWLLGEYVRQAEGLAPMTWESAAPQVL